MGARSTDAARAAVLREPVDAQLDLFADATPPPPAPAAAPDLETVARVRHDNEH